MVVNLQHRLYRNQLGCQRRTTALRIGRIFEMGGGLCMPSWVHLVRAGLYKSLSWWDHTLRETKGIFSAGSAHFTGTL
jgi:hypothetical protein